MSRGGPLDIAIVGMGCRFPGAPDLFAYWENVLAGRQAPRTIRPAPVESRAVPRDRRRNLRPGRRRPDARRPARAGASRSFDDPR